MKRNYNVEKEQAKRVAKNLGEWVTSVGEVVEITASGDTSFPYRHTTGAGHHIDYSEVYFGGCIEDGFYKRPYSEHGPVPVDHVDHIVKITECTDLSEMVPGVVYTSKDKGIYPGWHIVRIKENVALVYKGDSGEWRIDYYTILRNGLNLCPVYEWPTIPQSMVNSIGLAAVWAAVPDEVNEEKV